MRLSPVSLAIAGYTPPARPAEFVFKVNPYHDAEGRFTSKEKAAFQSGHIDNILSALGKEINVHPDDLKATASGVATLYAKYVKNAGAAGSNVMSIDAFAAAHGIEPEHMKKIKGAIAAKKAWQSTYKKQAVESINSEGFLKAAKAAMGGDAKSSAKYEMMLGAAEKQFLSNGGTDAEWQDHATKLLQKLADSTGDKIDYIGAKDKTPPAVDTGTVLSVPKAPSKPADWHSMSAGQKAAWTKKNNIAAAIAAVKPIPTVDANTILTPKVTPAPQKAAGDPMKPFDIDPTSKVWEEPGSLNHAKLQNEAIGKAYYLLRHKLGKDHPEVAKVYEEWQKSKDYLKANGVGNVSDLSTQQKNAAQSAIDQYEKAVASTKNNLSMVVAAFHEWKGKPGIDQDAASVKALQQNIDKQVEAATASGMSDSDIADIMESAKKKAEKVLSDKKAAALDAIHSAAYATFLKDPSDDGYLSASENLHLVKEEARKWGYGSGQIGQKLHDAKAQAASDKKKQAELAAMFGDKGKVIEYYDTQFKTLAGIENMHSFSGKHSLDDQQKAYFEHQKSQYENMTSYEQKMFGSFLGAGYANMNTGNNEAGKQTVAKGLSKMTLGADVTTRRNMAQKWLWESLGLKHWESGLSESDLQSAIGKVYKEESVMSTTKTLDNSFTLSSTAGSSGIASLIIRAHKDIKGIDATIAYGSSQSENEITFAPGLTMVIRKIEPVKQGKVKYKVHVDAIYTDNPHVNGTYTEPAPSTMSPSTSYSTTGSAPKLTAGQKAALTKAKNKAKSYNGYTY